MKPRASLTSAERQLAEITARVIATAEEAGLPDPPHKLGVSDHALCLLARTHAALCDQVRALHALVDLTDPADPVGVALTKVGLARRPPGGTRAGPRLALTPGKIEDLSTDELLALYCEVMGESREVFVAQTKGCWTNCTGEVGREEALRAWAARTGCVVHTEIDYYRIFPGSCGCAAINAALREGESR